MLVEKPAYFIMHSHHPIFKGTLEGDIDFLWMEKANVQEILSRIQTLQGVTKDAWLTYVGHQRPKMKLGVSMEQAIKISKDLKIKIQALVNE